MLLTNRQLHLAGWLSIIANGLLLPIVFIVTLIFLRNYFLDKFTTTFIITTILLIRHGLSAYIFSTLQKMLKEHIQFENANLALALIELLHVILVGFALAFGILFAFDSPADLDKIGNLVSAIKIYVVAIIMLTTFKLITGIITYQLALMEDFAFSLIITSSSTIILLLLWVSVLTGETVLNIYLMFIAVFSLVTEAIVHFVLGKVFFIVAKASYKVT
ncbi:MAG: hypothetical protein F6K41_25510 [Symploca sp. SIO3E6]|nr:hypothetical protein [Caldora sp. SIO3E6]